MQRRARKLGVQATKLAEQAKPMTKQAAVTARRTAGDAATWARPKVDGARSWLAIRAARGSVAVQDQVAPRVSAMLDATARRLDPPRPKSRRWPKLLAGAAVLAAGVAAAAAAAIAVRGRPNARITPLPRPSSDNGREQSSAAHSRAEAEGPRAESPVHGLSRTH
jgi:antitoxin (DNA-binding transcriptional repressor) of toxin-antitoxin stability system